MITKSIVKHIFIFLGSISLVLGLIGIFIPVLPTTPFLLLASFFYLRSSSCLYNWLIHHRIFGTYIYHYLTYRAVKKSAKIGALLFLWISLGFSIFVIPGLPLKLLLCAVGIAVSIHLLKLKTLESVKNANGLQIDEMN